MKKPKNKKIINPHKNNIYSSNKLIKKKEFQKQIKKNEIKRVNKTKINNELNDKMKLGGNIIAKFKNDFNKLTENKKYKLYARIYKKTDNEINDLPYIHALKFDKRTYFKFYFSLIKSNNLLFFSFLPKFDFNSKIIKIYLFFFNFATFYFVNALFFTDETMGKINTDRGTFNFIYNLPQIIYSSIISSIIDSIIKLLALTEDSFIRFRNQVKKEKLLISASKLKRTFKIKFLLFFIINLILLGCFWIYLSCFGAVYHNTQIYLIKDTLISFGTSLISPFGIYLLPGLFRIPSLKNKNRKIMYRISKIFQFLLL